jgi:hypothetical protein
MKRSNRPGTKSAKRTKAGVRRTKPLARVAALLLLDPVTVDEFRYAHIAAYAAATGRTPRQSFASIYEEAIDSGTLDRTKSHFVMRDIPENHAAFAIMDAFPDKTAAGDRLRQSLLWRVIFAAQEVFRDSRSRIYLKKEADQDMVAQPLIEAIATTPMAIGQAIPLDAIFAAAARIVADHRLDIDSAPAAGV